MSNWRLSLVLLMTLVSTGCQSLDLSDRFNLKRRIPWKRDEKEIRQGVPTRIVATWTDAVLHRPGQAERGFGGRLYFYDNKGGDPIEVEGQLVVYAFDETGREPTDNRPNRRFVFPPGQFEQHKSESELGVSYSVWLPWDAAQGGPPAEISLIARFEPAGKGNLITSDQTRQRLPGQGAPIGNGPSIAQEPSTPGVQQATITQSTLEPARKSVNQINYETPVDQITPPSEAATRMSTTSISLPSKFRRQSVAATVPAGESLAEPSMPASVPAATASGAPLPNVQSAADINFVGTQVSYLTAEESVRQSLRGRPLQGRSFGSSPSSPPVPATPASR